MHISVLSAVYLPDKGRTMKKGLRVAFSFLIFWTMTISAEVRIKITQGVDSARPIGVLPFQWIGPGVAPEDIGSIVANDLRNSGKFTPVDRSLLTKYSGNPEKIRLSDWSGLNIDLILVGQVIYSSGREYDVSYKLLDTSSAPKSTLLAQNTYKVNEKWLRYVGHTASDEVFEKLIGLKGAFRTRIAYIARTNNCQFPYEVRISDYDGHNQFTIHRSFQPLMSPSWSPDGTKLAYVTFEKGHAELVIQTLSNGTIDRVASFPRHNGAPAFSPDGKKLAFVLSKSGSLNIYVMDISSRKIHQITSGRSNSTEPSWFPDSLHLAFTSDQVGRPQVYKVNINGGEPKRITWEGVQNQNPDISTDGKMMVMVSTTESGQQHIAKQDLVTGEVKFLSSTTFLDETPSIAPNGTMVVYSSSKGIGNVLNLVSTDGRYKRSLSAIDGEVKSPAWSPYI